MNTKHLYERNRHGERRTLAKKFTRGTTIQMTDQSSITLKANVTMKVTQEYDVQRGWVDRIFHLDQMVETPEYEPPDPIPMPDPVELPRAEVQGGSWFSRWFRGWFS